MDVRNQECDLDLISTVVNFCQGQDVWWVDGGIVFLATILVYDGLEWSRQPNLNVGNWKRRIGFALWLVFGARARLGRSFRLVTLVGGVNLLSNLVGQLFLDVEEFFNGSRYIVRNSEAINWCSLRVALVGNYVGNITLSSTISKFVTKFVEFLDLTGQFYLGVLGHDEDLVEPTAEHSYETPNPMDMVIYTMWMRRIRLFDRGLSQDTLLARIQRESCAQGIYCFLQAKPVQEAHKKLLLFIAGVRSWLEAIKSLAVGKHARDRCSERAFLPVDFARVSEHVLLLPFICVD